MGAVRKLFAKVSEVSGIPHGRDGCGRLPGMTLRFLSRGEIAEHLGVTLGTVKQYANFPEPDVIVGRNQGWAVETVDRWWHNRQVVRAAGKALRAAAAEDPRRLPAPRSEVGAVREDLRPGADDSSGREPASLGAAPLGGAGAERPERSHRIGDSSIDLRHRSDVKRRAGGF